MQRNTENGLWSGKSYWEPLVREETFITPDVIVIMAALLRQSCLQIHAANVSIRVEKDAPRITEAG